MVLTDKLKFLNQMTSTTKLERGNESRRKSVIDLVSPDQITEQSLKVWRGLPEQIRQDPSLASFQMENERLHGTISFENVNHYQGLTQDENSQERSEFINMKYLRPKRNQIDASDVSSDGEGHHSDMIDQSEKIKQIKTKQQLYENRTKKCGLLLFWIFATGILVTTHENIPISRKISVPEYEDRYYTLPMNPRGFFRLTLFGVFDNSTQGSDFLTIQLQLITMIDPNSTDQIQVEDIFDPWIIAIVPKNLYDTTPIVSRNRTFEMNSELLSKLLDGPDRHIRLKMSTNMKSGEGGEEGGSIFTIKLVYDSLVVSTKIGTVLSLLILAIFYGLLVWEVFDRAFIAMICSIGSIAVLAALGDRPTVKEMSAWMDMEMLTLLFCMMILVILLTETGVFDYMAVVAFEISGGKIWPMIYSLCVITCLVSSFLDNMTTVLFFAPVAIRLSEVMDLDPVPVLIGVIVHANIGGALTTIGDPISIIISSNQYMLKNGITFFKFLAHTFPGVLLTAAYSCIYMRLVFWDTNAMRLSEPKEIKDLRREIKVWQRTAYSLKSFSTDVELIRETLIRKVKILKHKLKREQAEDGPSDSYQHTLDELKSKYPIKNKTLLIQSICSLIFIIICFLIQSMPQFQTLPPGWVALLGVLVLLIVSKRDDMDHLATRIEWTTLLFFAAMYVCMEAIERLGAILWLGEMAENIILYVSEEHRLTVAILIILTVSALSSAFLDSIPVTAMMVKVVVSLVSKESLKLPLQPLVWALVFGPSLGGNGTLYGGSANVLAAGIAEQHGYKIPFGRYLKIVFPMMTGQIAISAVYLLVVHVLFEWH